MRNYLTWIREIRVKFFSAELYSELEIVVKFLLGGYGNDFTNWNLLEGSFLIPWTQVGKEIESIFIIFDLQRKSVCFLYFDIGKGRP